MDKKLLKIFAEEAGEILEALEAGLLSLEGGGSPELINSVFRAAHTMKGNAGIVGFENVVELTHVMESLLDRMRQGKLRPEASNVGLLLSATDALREMVRTSVAGGDASPAPADILQPLQALADQGVSEKRTPPGTDRQSPPLPRKSPVSAQQRLHLSIKLQPDLFTTGTDPLHLLAELAELGEMERVICHVEDLPPLKQMGPLHPLSLVGGLAAHSPPSAHHRQCADVRARRGGYFLRKGPRPASRRAGANLFASPGQGHFLPGPAPVLRGHRPLPWGLIRAPRPWPLPPYGWTPASWTSWSTWWVSWSSE